MTNLSSYPYRLNAKGKDTDGYRDHKLQSFQLLTNMKSVIASYPAML